MIGILLKDNEFEQDIRELLMAFYPGERFAHQETEGVKFYVKGEQEQGVYRLEVDGETCRKIAATLVKTHGKQDFYRRIIGNYGQKKGLEIYKKVKSEYMNLKKMLENAQSAAS